MLWCLWPLFPVDCLANIHLTTPKTHKNLFVYDVMTAEGINQNTHDFKEVGTLQGHPDDRSLSDGTDSESYSHYHKD